MQKVLIVDKDSESAKFVGVRLKQAGIQPFWSPNGKEGLIAAWRERPHTIIIDPVIEDMDIKEMLEKIRKDRRTMRTKIIAFSSITDPELIQSAVNLGFDYYLTKESDAIDELMRLVHLSVQEAVNAPPPPLVSEMQSAPTPNQEPMESAPSTPTESSTSLSPEEILAGEMMPAEEQEPASPLDFPDQTMHSKGSGKLIVFLSAKGGVGTSSLCANIAHLFGAIEEQKTAVVDLVLPIGSISEIVGYDGLLNIVEISRMTGSEATASYLQLALPQPENWNFQILAGSPNPEEANQVDVRRIPVILNTLRTFYSYVFVDLGRSLSRISLPIIQNADQIVLVVSPDQSSVHHTITVLKYFQSIGVESNRIYPLLNRAVGLEGYSKLQIDDILGIVIPNTIPYMTSNFALANNQNMPVTDKFPEDVVSMSLTQSYQEILERISTGKN